MSRKSMARGIVLGLVGLLWGAGIYAVEPTAPDPVIADPQAVLSASTGIFQKLFFSTAYNSLKCQDNIYYLVRRLQLANMDLAQVKVVFIFDKDHDQLLPTHHLGVQRPDFTVYKSRNVATRPPAPNQFRYHVFAIVAQQVLDFDYTDSPTVTPVGTYFDTMYATSAMPRIDKRKLFERLLLRVIPAGEYIEDYPRHPSYYLFDLDKRYAARTLEAYIGSLPVDAAPAAKDGNRRAETDPASNAGKATP